MSFVLGLTQDLWELLKSWDMSFIFRDEPHPPLPNGGGGAWFMPHENGSEKNTHKKQQQAPPTTPMTPSLKHALTPHDTRP